MKYKIEPYADLRDADLYGAKLSGADLYGAEPGFVDRSPLPALAG